jgi:parallel beta-helix repeat protein
VISFSNLPEICSQCFTQKTYFVIAFLRSFTGHPTQVLNLTPAQAPQPVWNLIPCVKKKPITAKYGVGLLLAFLLTACGGGGGGTDLNITGGSSNSDYLQITGAGIKGPLAFADVKIFPLDLSLSDFYDKNSPIASAITNEFAEINGLFVPRDILPPYVLTVDGNKAIDLNTGMAPVISTLITVITEDMLADGRPIYATPLTTLVFHMAAQSATASASADANFFVRKMRDAASQVSRIFAIDPNTNIDVFGSPVVINDSTVTLAAQEEAVHHRAALEAFAAKIHKLSLSKGDGLKATYYNDLSLSNVALERIDETVNFNWQLGAPSAAVNADVFSVRWTGLLEPKYSEIYTFYTSSDDGVRLWVDGQLIVDNWTDQAETEFSGMITLAAGNKYAIVMEYYDNARTAVAKLLWSSASQPKLTIPKENLYSVTDPTLLENITPDSLIERLALDLQNDGVIDNSANGTMIGGIDPAILNQNPMKLLIPNTSYLVEDIVTLMEEERLSIRTDTSPIFFVESIAFGSEAHIELSVDSIDFGSQDVGGISGPFSLTLTNNSTGPLTLSGIAVSSGFIETNNCNDNLPVGVSCTIDVQFVPTATGDITGTLTITDRATNSTQVVSLTGVGSNGTPLNDLLASGQIIIDGESDVIISGLHISNPNGSCIEIINSATNIIVENSEIGPCGDDGIEILSNSSNITIRNNYIHDTKGEGIYAYLSELIEVTNNQIERISTGVFAVSSKQINVNNNTIRNVQGPFPRGQLVQFAYVKGAGNRITNNIGINEPGVSKPEDAINLYYSRGVPEDPIMVSNNVIIGGGPSTSGGGILLGDAGATSSYQIAKDNILVNPGMYGVGIAGGHHNQLLNNTVYSKQFPFTNVGVYVWDQYDSNCADNTVRGNRVNYTNKDGNKNPAWNDGNCGTIDGWSDNEWDAPIGEEIAGNL